MNTDSRQVDRRKEDGQRNRYMTEGKREKKRGMTTIVWELHEPLEATREARWGDTNQSRYLAQSIDGSAG